MDTDKFLLKWDGFTQNISSSYANLRYENDFTDVTLVSEDGELLKLHKIVLASSSEFFRDILGKYNNPCPLIYMKGFKAKYLTSIMDFIYFGETNVDQEDFEMFLSLSKDLEVKGISEEDHEKEYITDNRSEEDAKIHNRKLLDNYTEEGKMFKEDTYTSNQIIKDTDGLQGDEIDERINENIEKLHDPKSYRCKICGKTESPRNKILMKRHVEKNHLQLIHACQLCNKTFNVRNALQSHINYNHKETTELPCPAIKVEKTIDDNSESSTLVRKEGFEELDNKIAEMMEKLTNPSGYKCKMCGKISGTKEKTNLKQHIEKQHIKNGNFLCNFCEKTFSLSYSLKAHERSHNKGVNVLIKSL